MDHYLAETYWPGVYREAESSPTPKRRPFAELTEAFRAAESVEQLAGFAPRAQAELTGTADSHPCLSDRLAALGVATADALRVATRPLTVSAAERLLGATRPSLLARVDDEWRDRVCGEWADHYNESQAAKVRLAELDGAADRGVFDVDALLEHAELVDRFHGGEAALDLYHGVLERDPHNSVASYAVGRALLDRGDEAGLGYLDEAMAAEPKAILPACELAVAFLAERGQEATADVYRARARRRGSTRSNPRAPSANSSARARRSSRTACRRRLPAASRVASPPFAGSSAPTSPAAC